MVFNTCCIFSLGSERTAGFEEPGLSTLVRCLQPPSSECFRSPRDLCACAAVLPVVMMLSSGHVCFQRRIRLRDLSVCS